MSEASIKFKSRTNAVRTDFCGRLALIVVSLVGVMMPGCRDCGREPKRAVKRPPVLKTGCRDWGKELETDRDLLDQTMFYYLYDKTPEVAALDDFLLCPGFFLDVEHKVESAAERELFRNLEGLRKQANTLISATGAMKERWAKSSDSYAKTIAEMEPRRLAVSKLAVLVYSLADLAISATEYNAKALYLKGDDLKLLRKGYLDKGVDEKALPVDPKNRSEQTAFFESIKKKFRKDKNAIYYELKESVNYGWGFDYELQNDWGYHEVK